MPTFSKDMIREFNAPYDEHDEYQSSHYMNANLVAISGVPDVSFFRGEQTLYQLDFTLTQISQHYLRPPTDYGTHNDHEQTLEHHKYAKGARQFLQAATFWYAEIEVHQCGTAQKSRYYEHHDQRCPFWLFH